ncbi:hypothetical protein AB0F43_06760 [Kribbella sp. NPDC023972]|uniref:hypothetical protein n=1 Tax=Kribbella sp. NPDC023972 TaxID=3154795 RepID=UPI00340572E3
MLARDGLPVGYATTFGKGARAVIEIQVTYRHPGQAGRLFSVQWWLGTGDVGPPGSTMVGAACEQLRR